MRPGEVALRPTKGYESTAAEAPKLALGSALFSNRGEGEVGLGKVLFQIVGDEPPAAR